MKKILLSFIIVGAVAAGLIFAYREMSQERESEAESEAPVSAPSRVKRTAEGQVIITLEAPTQKLIQLQVAPAVATTLPREVRGYGQVLDPAPMASRLVDIASARAALETSTKELKRLETLTQQQNASVRALETAEASVKRDQLALEAGQLLLVAAWGKAVADQSDLTELVKSLATHEAALVRLNVPAGTLVDATPKGGRVTMANDTNSLFGPIPWAVRHYRFGRTRPGLPVARDQRPGRTCPGLGGVRFSGISRQTIVGRYRAGVRGGSLGQPGVCVCAGR